MGEDSPTTTHNKTALSHKIRLQRYFFETCNKWAKLQGLSVDIRILSKKGCLPLPRGYIHVEKHFKNCIKSEFKELATNGQSGKSFLLTKKKNDPKRFSALAPGLYTCIKLLENVYKIRIQRDHFETCNKWSK